MDKFFKITERGSNVKTEIIAGLTTFFAMSYIVVTNPNQIVSFNQGGAFDKIWLATYVASILVAVIGTLIYALYAKLPYAQACGMGLNSFFFVAFILPALLSGGDLIKGYQEGLCIILLSGIIFMILSFTGARQYIAKALPENLKKAIPAGIGLFIAFIGFKNVGLVQANKYTFLQLFDFHGAFDAVGKTVGDLVLAEKSQTLIDSFVNVLGKDNLLATITPMDAWKVVAPVVLTLVGLFLMAALAKRGSKGAVIISIGVVTVLYYLTTWTLPSFAFESIGESFGAFFEIGLFGAFKGFSIFEGGVDAILNAIVLIVTFCLVDMFDTIGTLYGTAAQADLLDENGDPIDIDKAMHADSVATLAGAVLGTSTCTTFVESAAGVGVGGKTGLASVVTAGCFFLCLFLTPLAMIIPGCATAPALIYVGVLMLKGFANVDMSDITKAVPAFLALIMMPLTYSISNGIAVACIAHTALALATKQYSKKDIPVTIIALLFLARFLLVTY